MKKYYSIIIILWAFLFQVTVSATEEIEKEQIKILAATFHHFDGKAKDQIWPHFYPLSYPAVFHYPSGNIYAFGFKHPTSGWRTALSHPYPVLYRSDPTDPLLQIPMQPAYLIDNHPAFLFGLNHDKEQSLLLLLTFIHERFHIFQFQTFAPEKVKEADEKDYEIVTQLALAELENRLLTQIIQTTVHEKQLHLIKDYIAVNQKRRQQLQLSSIQWENHQQKMEGLADYVSLKTYVLFPCLPTFSFESMVLTLREGKTKGKPPMIQDVMKGRHYFVGAVLGWLLDKQPGLQWKYAIEKRHYSLQQLLERAIPLSQQERDERFFQLQQQAEWQTLLKKIATQFESEKMNEQLITQAFLDEEGMIVWLGLPPCHTSTGGSHKKITHMERLKVLIGDTSFCTSQDHSWMLRFKNIPMRLEEPTGERTFKLSSDQIIVIDGQEYSLRNLCQLPQPIRFKTLLWKNCVCDFETICAGTIQTKASRVQISFDKK